MRVSKMIALYARVYVYACFRLVKRALSHRISKCEFKLWTITQGIKSKPVILYAEIRIISNHSLSCHETKL